MATLIIGAPWYKKNKVTGLYIGKPGQLYAFETYLKTGIGKGYAIPKKYIGMLNSGSKVILLRNDKDKKRTQGILERLIPTGKYTKQGIQRYDVCLKGQKQVIPYVYLPNEKLNRNGVKVT